MARLTKAELSDRSRYQFRTEEVEIPELGGSVEVKTLSVQERDHFGELIKKGEKAKAGRESIAVAAKVFALAVSDPALTEEEAEEFLGDLPGTALDRVMEQFGDLLGDSDEEEAAEKRREFRSEND